MITLPKDRKVEPIGAWHEVFVRTCSDRVQKAIRRAVRTPEICLERARAEMKALEQYKDEPRIIQRARIFETYLRDKTVSILEGELIVGNITSKVRASPIFPELHAKFVDEELDHPTKDFQARHVDRHIVHPEERKELREVILPYFKGRTVQDYLYSIADEEVKEKGFVMTASCPHIPGFSDLNVQQDSGHVMAGMEKVLHKGLTGIRQEVERKLLELDEPYVRINIQPRKDFYRAVLIVLDAAIGYAKRYAEQARGLATEETDPKRKMELEKIADVCDWVPANPARNWWEAVQTVWFIQCLVYCEQVNYASSFARFDQYMYPFFKKSVLDDKSLTRDEALELLECFWVKCNEFTELYNYETARVAGGFPISANLLIGGQTREGKDACNEVTMLCLESEEQVGLIQPEIAMRVWAATPTEYLRKAAEVVRLGRGKLKFYSDRTAIQMMKKHYPELAIEDWREYAVNGCVEICLPNITMHHHYAGLYNAAKALELALNNGKCALCGEQVGPLTGDPRSFESMAGVKAAFQTQMSESMRIMLRAITTEMLAQAKLMPAPFASSLYEGPIEKGADVVGGGAWYTKYGVLMTGLANTADSLSVIDKLIYRDKRITWDDLLTALKANWEGFEWLRQMCINDVPKYGNDIDYADEFAAYVMDTWHDIIDWANTQKSLLPPFGGKFSGATIVGNSQVAFGEATAALPHGRKHPQPLADTMSPVQGADRNGPTAVIKSVSKMPAHRFTLGTSLNQRLSPQLLATERDIDNFVSFLRACEELGVYHIQFNVMTSDLLKRAMENLEEFKWLTVRVASYVAYFCDLDPATQQDIINRTEQKGW